MNPCSRSPVLAFYCLILCLCQWGRAAEKEAPTASPSRRDPSEQAEKDWVDNRWQQTDVGQFLASNLAVSGDRVAKALSIKVGEGDEAAVSYDTGRCALRAAWTGEFLRFDSRRYGLI